MNYFFHPETQLFYVDAVHGNAIPDGSTPVSADQFEVMTRQRDLGCRLELGEGGQIVAVAAPVIPESLAVRQAAASQRRAAVYREEADGIFFKVQRGEAEHSDWLAKIAEIKQRFPDPAL